ncbi:hypothetical protein LCGC14_1754650 [marine sediment metagenome]|uniref:Uncharacterized protein n=1 Tax=marine sediment metagenome TaxID=412755 RepID=A0A0F9H2W6_9ZZZZ
MNNNLKDIYKKMLLDNAGVKSVCGVDDTYIITLSVIYRSSCGTPGVINEYTYALTPQEKNE